jgi:hypothetical protein
MSNRWQHVRVLTIVTMIAGAVLLEAAAAAAQPAASSYDREYVDELMVSKAVEEHGLPYRAGRVAIDNASCIGLRRYGARTSADGYTETFWRFRCSANGADSHFYDVQVSSTAGPKSGYVYWHWLSVKRSF